jgi:hypothetical protein
VAERRVAVARQPCACGREFHPPAPNAQGRPQGWAPFNVVQLPLAAPRRRHAELIEASRSLRMNDEMPRHCSA